MRVQTVDDETRKAFHEAQDVRLRERLHAVLLSADGRAKRDIADILFCELERVTEWIRIYNDGGLRALENPGSSDPMTPAAAPAKDPAESRAPSPESIPEDDSYAGPLSGEARSAIRECLRFSPRMYRRRSDFWSTSALAEVLRQRLGLVIPHEHVAEFLSQAGVARVTSRADLKKLEEKLAEDAAKAEGSSPEGAAPLESAEPAIPAASEAPSPTTAQESQVPLAGAESAAPEA